MNHSYLPLIIACVVLGILFLYTPQKETFQNVHLQKAIIQLFNNKSVKYSQYLEVLSQFNHTNPQDRSINVFIQLKQSAPLSSQNFL